MYWKLLCILCLIHCLRSLAPNWFLFGYTLFNRVSVYLSAPYRLMSSHLLTHWPTAQPHSSATILSCSQYPHVGVVVLQALGTHRCKRNRWNAFIYHAHRGVEDARALSAHHCNAKKDEDLSFIIHKEGKRMYNCTLCKSWEHATSIKEGKIECFDSSLPMHLLQQ